MDRRLDKLVSFTWKKTLTMAIGCRAMLVHLGTTFHIRRSFVIGLQWTAHVHVVSDIKFSSH